MEVGGSWRQTKRQIIVIGLEVVVVEVEVRGQMQKLLGMKN